MRNTGLIPGIANDKTPRKVSESALESHAIVHPVDTNALNNAFGGYLMSLMDEAACIVAFKHAGRKVNTVSIDGVRFFRPTAVGTILNIHATPAISVRVGLCSSPRESSRTNSLPSSCRSIS